MIPGLDKGVAGMQVGENKSISVTPEEGFGQYNKKGATTVRKNRKKDFHDDVTLTLEVGKQMKVTSHEGRQFQVRITRVEGEEVDIDANHPLARQTLNLNIDTLAIEKEKNS